MSSTLTVFAVFEVLAREQPIGLSELARKMNIAKSTVQRCLETLGQAGWIEPESPSSKRWVISIKPYALAVTAIQRGGLRDRALPVMNRLSDETDETIHLTVRDGREVVLVERVDSPHALRAVAAVGSRGPLHATSNGKAILAALGDAEVIAYIDDGLPRVTEHTLTDPDTLLSTIRKVRATGFATSDEELQIGVVSVGSVIRNGAGQPIASLSISGPRDRMTPIRRRELGPLVKAASQEITSQLTYET